MDFLSCYERYGVHGVQEALGTLAWLRSYGVLDLWYLALSNMNPVTELDSGLGTGWKIRVSQQYLILLSRVI